MAANEPAGEVARMQAAGTAGGTVTTPAPAPSAAPEQSPAPVSSGTPVSATRRKKGLSLTERQNRIIGLLSPLVILLLWELGVWVGGINGKFFPPPSDIAGAFVEMAKSGQLAEDVGISLWRVIAGFVLGAVPGLIVGLSMGLFRPVRMALRPIISATYPIPKLALMPLIVLIFGFGELQKVVTIALGTFFLVLINTMAGVLNVDNIYLDVAKNYGASRRDFYTKVALPGAMPMIFAGLELGMGMALLLIVAAEMQGAISGIGYRIWASQAVFNVKEMFVAFILIALLGYIFAETLTSIQRKVIPWKR